MQILKLLMEVPGYRSGQEMGALLNCSRAAVGKAVEILRAQNFVISASPRRGYHLVSEPQGLVPARVEARLESGDLGQPFIHLAEIGSTNQEARRRAEKKSPHGTCVLAEFQTAGRGRLDRRWIAPARSCLLFSIILRPTNMTITQAFTLTSLAAVTICQVLENEIKLSPVIKWPNDIFVNGRKLTGILTEIAARGESLEYAVVGIGLNVNLTSGRMKHIFPQATSIQEITGRNWDRALLLVQILRKMSELYARVESGQWTELEHEYRKRSCLLEQEVQLKDGEKILQGKVQEIALDGTLKLRQADGSIVDIRHGDATIIDF